MKRFLILSFSALSIVAIAQGNFNIVYFQIGDSEYDYNGMFTGLTGVNSHQKIFH